MKECLKHPWLTPWKHVASHQRETISSESQRKNSAFHNCPTGAATLACPRSAASINGHGSSPSMTARSLQRAMSKSREVLYERVAASNLRKSTSKSRERLCEMRLSVSRSRDHLCDELQSSSAQSLERIHSLRNLSKSHEVLSLLNQQSSTISLADSSSLFNILPSTQSLECFTIPNLDRDENVEIMSNPNAISTKGITAEESNAFGELLELNKVLSESTETLCDETGTATQLLDVMDEVTPSNSRSETPTEELDPDTQKAENDVLEAQPANSKEKEMDENSEALQLQDEVKFESLVTRADAVASSLKRLSSSGPPSLKILPSESLSPALGKSVWNWPIPSTILIEGATSSSTSKTPVSPNVTTGHSVHKNSSPPPSFNLKDQQPSTSPLPTDESLAVVLRSDTACTDSPQNPPSAAVKTTDPLTPARMSATSIDTTSLSDSQRQLLTSCLNRRRASWACGSRQEDVSSAINTASVSMSKQPETKLSVSELISSFNRCKKPDSATNAIPTVISSTGPIKPSNVKKIAVGSIFHQDSAVTHPGSASSGRVISEKEKTVFKPVSTSIQVFQKNLLTTPVTTPTGLLTGTVQRNIEASTRPRSSWEVRALPRLPEDTVCSPPQEGPMTSATSESGINNSSEDKLIQDSKEKTITAPEEEYGLRSGSVSSDTGCSSSSDLSDRSSDEGLDGNREPRRKKTSGRECGNGSEPEADLIEGALTSPPASWTGRPRSFSVQSEISLLAQPWNRVCIGSVARAFEKFGTKVDGDTSSNNPSSTSNTHRSRRQSTPGPFK